MATAVDTAESVMGAGIMMTLETIAVMITTVEEATENMTAVVTVTAIVILTLPVVVEDEGGLKYPSTFIVLNNTLQSNLLYNLIRLRMTD